MADEVCVNIDIVDDPVARKKTFDLVDEIIEEQYSEYYDDLYVNRRTGEVCGSETAIKDIADVIYLIGNNLKSGYDSMKEKGLIHK